MNNRICPNSETYLECFHAIATTKSSLGSKFHWNLCFKMSLKFLQLFSTTMCNTFDEIMTLADLFVHRLYFFNNGPFPASFSFIHHLFKQTLRRQFLQQIHVKKCPSSKRWWDSNPRPSEHESPPITTISGLLSYYYYLVTILHRSLVVTSLHSILFSNTTSRIREKMENPKKLTKKGLI